MKTWKMILITVFLLLPILASNGAAEEEENTRNRNAVYPILIHAPIFGVDLNSPDVPGGGGGDIGSGGSIDISTDTSLNGAYGAGFSITREKWILDFEGLYANLDTSTNRPIASVDTKLYSFYVLAGWTFYRDFSLTGGIKRFTVDFHAELGNALDANFKPGLWDPLVGLDWRRPVSDKLWVNGAFQVGGFGAGTDVEVYGKFAADWEFVNHVSLQLGYDVIYFKATVLDVEIGSFQRELTLKQTLHGPRFGLGIIF